MSKYIINGPVKLFGKVKISGAKNAALKLLPAAILADSPSTINNVPEIIDVEKMVQIIRGLGAKISYASNTVSIDPTTINSTNLEEKYVKKLRGSVIMVGPMLAKYGKVKFFQPGGCLIGARGIEDHLDLFEQMGVKIIAHDDYYEMIGKPKPGNITLRLSVTATENAIMASVLSKGVTNIHVAAAEPEIADLANFLNKMGAKVEGAGTHDIKVTGVESLHGSEYSVMPDRIEAGTYLMIAIATNSEFDIFPVIPNHLSLVIKILEQTNAKFDIIDNGQYSTIKTRKHGDLKSVYVDTRTYPGFPTDLQSVYAVLATQSEGSTKIFETLFESRFGYINELKKMGADISVDSPYIVNINGPIKLSAKKINALDIRGGAALVLAALVAQGKTEINNIELIERGYEKMDQKLKGLGVDIKVVR